MNSNFTFLKSDFPALHEVCIEAEKNLYGAFRTIIIYGIRPRFVIYSSM